LSLPRDARCIVLSLVLPPVSQRQQVYLIIYQWVRRETASEKEPVKSKYRSFRINGLNGESRKLPIREVIAAKARKTWRGRGEWREY
jgi:hypothetical protein